MLFTKNKGNKVSFTSLIILISSEPLTLESVSIQNLLEKVTAAFHISSLDYFQVQYSILKFQIKSIFKTEGASNCILKIKEA